MSEVNLMDMGAMFGFDDMTELQKKLMEGFLTEDQVLAIKQAYVDTMTAKSSLSGTLDKLGYSTFETPSIICFYPKSFESKEELNEMIGYYNEQVTADGHEEYEISPTDPVGMLLSSVTKISWLSMTI